MVAFRGLFHLGCGVFYVYGTYYDLQIVTAHTTNYGGRFKYLTFLNLVRVGNFHLFLDLGLGLEGLTLARHKLTDTSFQRFMELIGKRSDSNRRYRCVNQCS